MAINRELIRDKVKQDKDRRNKRILELLDKAATGVSGLFGLQDVYTDIRNLIIGSGVSYEEKIKDLTGIISNLQNAKVDPKITNALVQAQNEMSAALNSGGADRSSVWAANRAAGMAKQKRVKDAQERLQTANTAYEDEVNRVSNAQNRVSNLTTAGYTLADKGTVYADKYFSDVMDALKQYK